MERELYWQAVKANDRMFDGVFVLGVKTTGIYCRPSCRARLPKRENVDFYPSPRIAEASGFRACLRCRPQNADEADPRVAMVMRVCGQLEQADSITLDELAVREGLSPFHLQRSFKEIVGVSPKKYAEAKRMEKLKNSLRTGQDVTAAMYDAGFGSSSRLYSKAAENLGMTPAIYKKGGKDSRITFIVTDCELGKLLVARTSRGICSVTFGDDAITLREGLGNEFPNAEIAEDDGELRTVADTIIRYLAGEEKKIVLPLDLRATAFQMQVWELLRKIPYGETRSYSEIAEELGDRKKVRAVAQACARNRVAVLIPCHRVVASNGTLSGYRWGVERKSELLKMEREP